MPADNTTNKIKFDISELKAGITESNRLIKLANSQFKAAASGMEEWENSSEGLEAKLKQLNAVQEQETKKLENLKEQYKLVAEEQGENSAGAIKLATQINNQQAAVNKINGEMSKYENRLDTVKSAEAEAERSGREFADVLREVDDAAGEADRGVSEAEGGFTVMKGALADLASNAVQWAIGALKDLGAALMELPEATKEYRTTFAAVEQSASDSVIGIDGAKKAYEEFYSIAADEGQAAEATSHIAGLVSSQEDLQGALNGVIGAWVEYGDSISIEGLAEASNETAKTGVVTGQFADALNWASESGADFSKALSGNKAAQDAFNNGIAEGMSAEDAFNAALATCTSTQERQKLVVDTLNGVYGENTKQYKENNASLVDANAANLHMLETQSKLATAIEPLTAAWTNLKASALDAITPVIDSLSAKLQDLLKWLDEHETAAALLTAVITGLAAAFGVLAGALLISNLISMVQKAFALLNTTMLANPVVLIVAGIAALVVALVTLWNKSESFRNFWIGLWENIKGVFGGAIDFIKSAFNAVINFFTVTIPGVFNSVVSFFKNNWQTILLFIINPFAGVIALLWQKSETFREIVNKIVTFFKELPGKIWNAIIGAVSKIGEWGGCMKNKAVDAATKVVSGLVNKLKEIPNKVVSIGGNVVKGLWNGISDKVEWLKNKISGFVGNVKGWLKKFFKIGSPSKLMRDEIGRFLPEGIAVGIKDYAFKAINAVRDLSGKIMGATDISGYSIPQLNGAAAGGAVVNNYTFNQTNNSPTALSRVAIYRDTKQLIKQIKRVK